MPIAQLSHILDYPVPGQARASRNGLSRLVDPRSVPVGRRSGLQWMLSDELLVPGTHSVYPRPPNARPETAVVQGLCSACEMGGEGLEPPASCL